MPGPAPVLHDVVIAGGGPVGLFLATELRLAAVSVLVLEQAEDPRSPFKRLPFGMRGLSAPSIDSLDRRGLLDALEQPVRPGTRSPPGADTSRGAHWMQETRRPAGHFAGIPFYEDDVDTSRWRYRRAGGAGTSLAIELEHLEAVLAARAVELGVEIRRGLAVEAIERSDEAMTVRAGSETVRCRFLVGCDGGRSAVRKKAGFAVLGTDPELTGYTCDVDLADADALQPGRHLTPTGMYTFARPGTLAMVEFDGGASHRAKPITIEHVQAVLRRVSGTDAVVTKLRLAATWTDRAQQAATYRHGRVLLAGDAAHIHSPLGGQGLNLGLGDATNLGWKLAATIRGDAPAGLLDTYEDERHPPGARILDWSRAQVALMRPNPGTRALGSVIRDLLGTRDGATYFAERVRGVSLRYDLGDDHPLVGCGAPDFGLADGTRLNHLLQDGRGFLLDFDRRRPLALLANGFEGRIRYAGLDATDRLGLTALLVRPDGVVAWAADAAPDEQAAARAMSRWFGDPVTAPDADGASYPKNNGQL